jgi:hypothetical protein
MEEEEEANPIDQLNPNNGNENIVYPNNDIDSSNDENSRGVNDGMEDGSKQQQSPTDQTNGADAADDENRLLSS